MGWGLDDLGDYIIEAFFEFILDILNLPIKFLLNLISHLLTEPVKISIFANIWSIIIYILSMFYGILLVYIGLKFIVSGESPEQRENAKSSLRNTIIMIVLVQASFLIYSLILEIFAGLTKAMFNMIGNNFFVLTYDNFANIGLEIAFLIPYLSVLILTLIILAIRYICVSAGVIFFALGIFFYFVPFLNQYGKLIINGLIVLISLPLFYSIIFLTSSKLLELSIFQNIKILVMIGAFSLVILSTLLLLLFVIIKAALKIAKPIGSIAKIAKYVS